MISKKWGRMDLDSLCPYCGEDPRGELDYPGDQELKEYVDSKAKVTKYSKGVAMFGGRPCEPMHLAIQTMMKVEKVMRLLVHFVRH